MKFKNMYSFKKHKNTLIGYGGPIMNAFYSPEDVYTLICWMLWTDAAESKKYIICSSSLGILLTRLGEPSAITWALQAENMLWLELEMLWKEAEPCGGKGT